MTCDAFRVRVLGEDGALDAAAAAHEAQCASCRRWLARFAEGTALWRTEPSASLAEAVMAGSGGACERAMARLAEDRDQPLPPFERRLVAAHLDRCRQCRAFAAELEALLAGLPELAALEPGPGFAERVWASTSRRPSAARWADRLRRGWDRWVRRPRFAWELAYAVTVCWVLAFGGPVAAWEWSKSQVTTIAARPLPERVLVLGDTVPQLRAALVSEAAPAVNAVEGMPSRFARWLEKRWAAAAVWANHVLVRFEAAFDDARQRAVEWFRQLAGRDGGEPTEPGAGPVRSSA